MVDVHDAFKTDEIANNAKSDDLIIQSDDYEEKYRIEAIRQKISTAFLCVRDLKDNLCMNEYGMMFAKLDAIENQLISIRGDIDGL